MSTRHGADAVITSFSNMRLNGLTIFKSLKTDSGIFNAPYKIQLHPGKTEAEMTPISVFSALLLSFEFFFPAESEQMPPERFPLQRQPEMTT